jgi:hypothetical protein
MTALQISPGENWQNVVEGSIMYRMFRGWNERRQVVGKPMLSYQNAAFVPVDNIADARIYAGANLQNAAFWRALQTEDFTPVAQDSRCVLALGKITQSGQFRTIRETFAESASDIDNLFGVAIRPIAQGDIISAETINAIFRRFEVYSTVHLRLGNYEITDYGYVFVPQPGTPSDRQSPRWLEVYVEESTGAPIGSATYSMSQPYNWPEYFIGATAQYVWRSAGNGEQFGTTQPSIVYAYDEFRPTTATGIYNSFDIFTEDKSTWPPFNFTFQSGPEFPIGYYTSATTLNMIIQPPFADLPDN